MLIRIHLTILLVFVISVQAQAQDDYSYKLKITSPGTATLFFFNNSSRDMKCSGSWYYDATQNWSGKNWSGSSCKFDGHHYCNQFYPQANSRTDVLLVVGNGYSINGIDVLNLNCVFR